MRKQRKRVVFGRVNMYYYSIYIETNGLYTIDVELNTRTIHLTANTLDEARNKVKEVTS